MVKCQFEILEKEGEVEKKYVCNKEAEGIIRCKDVCKYHFGKLRTDNLYRLKRGIDIPEDTTMLIKTDKRMLAVKEEMPEVGEVLNE